VGGGSSSSSRERARARSTLFSPVAMEWQECTYVCPFLFPPDSA
jgi:hypothetical protein